MPTRTREDAHAGHASGKYAGDVEMGMAPVRDSIFDPAFGSTVDGTGFGRVTVRRIVEALGWDIRVTEGETGGARFEILDR